MGSVPIASFMAAWWAAWRLVRILGIADVLEFPLDNRAPGGCASRPRALGCPANARPKGEEQRAQDQAAEKRNKQQRT